MWAGTRYLNQIFSSRMHFQKEETKPESVMSQKEFCPLILMDYA